MKKKNLVTQRKLYLELFIIIVFVFASPNTFSQDMNSDAARLYNSGNELLREGNYLNAVSEYNEALKIQKDYRIYYQKGLALKRLGNYDSALDAFQQSANLKSNFAATYNAIGGVYYALGKYELAAENFEKVIGLVENEKIKKEVQENLCFALTKLGADADQAGDPNKAVEYLEKAVTNSNFDAAYLALAKVYTEIGDNNKALNACQKALNYRKTISEGGPYYYMGIAYKNIGNKNEAYQMFINAERDPIYVKSAKAEITALNEVTRSRESENNVTYNNQIVKGEGNQISSSANGEESKQNTDNVDLKIPRCETENPNAIALILAISSYQDKDISPDRYAKNDAQVLREYLIKTLGFSPDNILPRDPNELLTYGKIRTYIQKILPSYLKPNGSSDLFVYYSGHGAPNTTNHDAYLVPWDCNPNYVGDDNAYDMKEFYLDISKLDARNKIIVVDACFSGQAGNGKSILSNVSSAMLRINNPLITSPNTVIFQSSMPDQVSNWYDQKKHSMFTYFFLKGLQGAADLNKDGKITSEELINYIDDPNNGLPYYSNRLYQRPQDAQLAGSKNLVIERRIR